MDVSDDGGNLVDVFVVAIEPATLTPGAMDFTAPLTSIGRFSFATIELSFQLECLPGFFGEECLNICDPSPCNNGSLCEPDDAGNFTCTCEGDFTGRSCDVTIDDCLNVNCNNGTCVDGVGTFTCECEAGYTGQFCEEMLMIIPTTSIATTIEDVVPAQSTLSNDKIDGVIPLTATPSPGLFATYSSSSPTYTPTPTPTSLTDNNTVIVGAGSNVGVVAGAVVGSILFVLLLASVLVILSLLFIKMSKGNCTGHVVNCIYFTCMQAINTPNHHPPYNPMFTGHKVTIHLLTRPMIHKKY